MQDTIGSPDTHLSHSILVQEGHKEFNVCSQRLILLLSDTIRKNISDLHKMIMELFTQNFIILFNFLYIKKKKSLVSFGYTP